MQPRNRRSVLFHSFFHHLSLRVGSISARPSVVSPDYFCNVDVNLMRLDHLQRPELNKGTVDFIVPEEYWASPPPLPLTPSYYSVEPPSSTPRKPQSMNYLFAFDVSLEAVQSGFLRTACTSLRDMLYGRTDAAADGMDPCFPTASHIAILTFDRSLHFYNLSVSDIVRELIRTHADMFVATFNACTNPGAVRH
jgi:protein transport protein SEC24